MLNISRAFFVSILCIVTTSSFAGSWSKQELRVLKSFDKSHLPSQVSHSSNQYALNTKAAKLGEQIFFDKRFSLDGSIACASCHQPSKGFTDGLNKAQGIHKTGRNTQTLLGATYQEWFYWDGRKDSLWAQALVPFEAADEMASSRVQVLRIIGNDKAYRQQYENIFGQFPTIVFEKTIQANAGPWGDQQTRNNWYRIPQPTKLLINRAYANIGKAMAAFERTIKLPETAFDRYLTLLSTKGEEQANKSISSDALKGMKLFINSDKTHCMRCHNGPLFSNGGFHNIGTGNFKGKQLDFGRYLGIQAVTQDEFNCIGTYSDAKKEDCKNLRFLSKQIHGEMQGAFKTPTLRYLNKTAPYFHDGRFKTIQEVITHYQSISPQNSELPSINLTKTEQSELIAFLELLYAP